MTLEAKIAIALFILFVVFGFFQRAHAVAFKDSPAGVIYHLTGDSKGHEGTFHLHAATLFALLKYLCLAGLVVLGLARLFR